MKPPSDRVTLAQKYNLPPITFGDDSSLCSDREPFGWNIGIRDRHSKYSQVVEKQRQERNL